ncbi:membrane protein [Mixta theicola]|nr:membrane protein [Mixta theicola]
MGIYLYLDNRHVNIISAHHDRYSAEVLVDHLPITASSAINWWLENQSAILKKYHIPSGDAGGPTNFTVFAFGTGYRKEDANDMLCFDDMPSPENCIDKEILLTVGRNREGNTRFAFGNSAYIRYADGRITELKKETFH